MRILARVLIVLAAFFIAALAASHLVMQHELARVGAPFAEVKLVSWAAGLFAGSLAALVVGIAVLWKR